MAKPISAGKREMILNGNLVKAILTLAIPVMLNSFIQSMYNLTDTFWLGKIGTTSQAAITLVSPFQNILINFGAGITTAGAILPPIAVGRPIFNIDITLFLSNLKPLKLILTSWFFPVSITKPMMALGIFAISVANAAVFVRTCQMAWCRRRYI